MSNAPPRHPDRPDRRASLRKAAREQLAKASTLRPAEPSGGAALALPPVPTKLDQLEALVRAGRADDPLSGVAATPVGPTESGPEHPPQAGEGPDGDHGERTSGKPATLLDRVRDIYENTIVPVREIARLVGVTERTLYKYVDRHGWARRHVCIARDEAVRSANRGRLLAPRSGFDRAKGAGGRFVTRDETAPPHQAGLKALDPLGAERVIADCEEARRLSDTAITEAVANATVQEALALAGREREAAARVLTEAAGVLRQAARLASARLSQPRRETIERPRDRAAGTDRR
jgi:hypothetical protein